MKRRFLRRGGRHHRRRHQPRRTPEEISSVHVGHKTPPWHCPATLRSGYLRYTVHRKDIPCAKKNQKGLSREDSYAEVGSSIRTHPAVMSINAIPACFQQQPPSGHIVVSLFIAITYIPQIGMPYGRLKDGAVIGTMLAHYCQERSHSAVVPATYVFGTANARQAPRPTAERSRQR